MWKKSVIVPLYKKKHKLCCNNYRGISLLSHCEKLMASILLQRFKKRTDEVLTEAQAGFWADHSAIDQLFTLRCMTEEYIEYGKDLYVCYVNFQKAFHSVWRTDIWHVMRHLGYDEKIIRLLEALYKDTMSTVWVDGELTQLFQNFRRHIARLYPVSSALQHINKMSSTCFYHLQCLRLLCRLVDQAMMQHLVSVFVISTPSYCNSTLAGLPACALESLQLVLHAVITLGRAWWTYIGSQQLIA